MVSQLVVDWCVDVKDVRDMRLVQIKCLNSFENRVLRDRGVDVDVLMMKCEWHWKAGNSSRTMTKLFWRVNARLASLAIVSFASTDSRHLANKIVPLIALVEIGHGERSKIRGSPGETTLS